MGFWAFLLRFSPRLRDLGVIFVGIYEAHVHTYFGHFLLNEVSFLALVAIFAIFGPV